MYSPKLSPYFPYLQISSLVETHGSVGALGSSAVARVGQAVNVAVERFVTVGETIADDYPEVRDGMYEACKEARQAGELNYFNYFENVRYKLRFTAYCTRHSTNALDEDFSLKRILTWNGARRCIPRL